MDGSNTGHSHGRPGFVSHMKLSNLNPNHYFFLFFNHSYIWNDYHREYETTVGGTSRIGILCIPISWTIACIHPCTSNGCLITGSSQFLTHWLLHSNIKLFPALTCICKGVFCEQSENLRRPHVIVNWSPISLHTNTRNHCSGPFASKPTAHLTCQWNTRITLDLYSIRWQILRHPWLLLVLRPLLSTQLLFCRTWTQKTDISFSPVCVKLALTLNTWQLYSFSCNTLLLSTSLVRKHSDLQSAGHMIPVPGSESETHEHTHRIKYACNTHTQSTVHKNNLSSFF